MRMTYTTTQDRYLLADGRLRVPVIVNISVHLPEGLEVSFKVVFREESQSLVAKEIAFTSPEGVTGNDLRRIPVQDYIRSVTTQYVSVWDTETGKLMAPHDALENMAPSKGRDKDEVTKDAATLYLFATLIGERPLKLVSDVLKVSHSTATRLVSAARNTGLLDKPAVPEFVNPVPVDELERILSRPRKPKKPADG